MNANFFARKKHFSVIPHQCCGCGSKQTSLRKSHFIHNCAWLSFQAWKLSHIFVCMVQSTPAVRMPHMPGTGTPGPTGVAAMCLICTNGSHIPRDCPQKLINSLSSDVGEKKGQRNRTRSLSEAKSKDVHRVTMFHYVSGLSLYVCGCCHGRGGRSSEIVEVLHVLLDGVHGIVQFVHAALKVLGRTLHGRAHEALQELAHQVPAA